MSVSPKNSRGGGSNLATTNNVGATKRSQASGSKTARNKDAKGGFNFRIEIMNEEEKNPELRSNMLH